MSESIGVLITGARDWKNEKPIYSKLKQFQGQNITLIHGGCVGADLIADKVGKKLGYTIKIFLPEWQKYGRGAGPKRNKDMVDFLQTFNIKYVFAFHEKLEASKGTKNCVELAIKSGLKCNVVDIDKK